MLITKNIRSSWCAYEIHHISKDFNVKYSKGDYRYTITYPIGLFYFKEDRRVHKHWVKDEFASRNKFRLEDRDFKLSWYEDIKNQQLTKRGITEQDLKDKFNADN